MRVKLMNVNVDEGIKEVELIFIPRKKEIVIATPDGTEIATLDVCMMPNYPDIQNTNNYWLQFWPVIQRTDINRADVYVEEIKEKNK